MLEPLRKLNIPFSFYSINTHFELQEDIAVSDDSLIVIHELLGLKDEYCRKLEASIEQVDTDDSQAFYADTSSMSHTFYSPRKFLWPARRWLPLYRPAITPRNPSQHFIRSDVAPAQAR